MPAGSFLTLLDDIATVLDDVSVMTKVAVKKTAGVLGDDLALNAQQVTGVQADRELPVVWAVAKGSIVNKAILVPAALLISAIAPWSVTPLLVIGGLFLCFEGVEKLWHKLFHGDEEAQEHREHAAAVASNQDLVALEKDKIKGAIRTDFILSAEIVTIALGTVADKPIGTRVGVLCGVAALMTVGVYGLVAGIVKMDDLGLSLHKKGGIRKALGTALLRSSPLLMKGLSIAGTAAMFLVGGGIVVHGVPFLHHAIESLEPRLGAAFAMVAMLANAAIGIAAGAMVLGLVTGAKKAVGK